MEKKKNISSKRSACAISMSLDAVGDKWSLLILRDLMFTDKRSYCGFQSSAEGIATNILAARLMALEANGIIYKISDTENGRRGLYYLTEKGIGLLPVVLELMHWMEKYGDGAEACAATMKSFKKDRTAVLKSTIKQLRASHLKRV